MYNVHFYILCFKQGIWDYYHYRDVKPDWMVDLVEIKNWTDGYNHARSVDLYVK